MRPWRQLVADLIRNPQGQRTGPVIPAYAGMTGEGGYSGWIVDIWYCMFRFLHHASAAVLFRLTVSDSVSAGFLTSMIVIVPSLYSTRKSGR